MKKHRIFIAIAFIACFTGIAVFGFTQQVRATTMENQPYPSVWDFILALESHMPLSVPGVEDVIGTKLVKTSETEHYVVYEAEGPELGDGTKITTARLMLRPSLKFEDNSGMTVEMKDSCITITDVRDHFSELNLIQSPRGGSLDETTAWATKRPWGYLSFAFQERNPNCLFSVTFHKDI